MPDMMAIVSKAIFEKAAGKAPSLGTQLRMDRYVSANKALEPLNRGGRLYLVTVRPPDEALWLVAILDTPTFDGAQWVAQPSHVAITDISALRSQIKFESGVGITAKAGALGMSLQTPRALTAADAALLDAATGGAPPAIGKTTVRRGSLLDAILDDPENDDARRVYADQLIANNDPRGELILVDIALAGPLSIRKRAELASRRKELLEQHAATWWPYTAGGWRIHKGMLTAVTGTWEQIAAIAPQLFAAEPVTELTVSIADDAALAALLAAPWLPRIRRLTMRGLAGDDAFGELVRAPGLSRLRALNVTGNELGSDAVTDLDRALPALEDLVLTRNPLGDDGLAALATWKQLPRLRALYLTGCEVFGEGIPALCKKPLANLVKLTLGSNELGDDGAEALAKSATRLSALEHLELTRIELEPDGAERLAKAKWAKLRRLDLRLNNLPAKLASDPRIRV